MQSTAVWNFSDIRSVTYLLWGLYLRIPQKGAMLTLDNDLLVVAFLALRYVRSLQAPSSLPRGEPVTWGGGEGER